MNFHLLIEYGILKNIVDFHFLGMFWIFLLMCFLEFALVFQYVYVLLCLIEDAL